MDGTATGTRVGRLRVRGADPGRVARALAAADLTLPGWPPDAVLCVRAVTAPLAGLLGGPGPARRAWDKGLSAALAALSRSAARPAREAVPAAAAAVWFADRAELLACLITDILAGETGRWWWAALFPDRVAARVPVAEFAAAPELLPAVLARLAAAGTAVAYVQTLSPRAAAGMITRLADRFAAPALHAVADRATGSLDPIRPDQELGVAPPAPWVSEADVSELSVPHQALLGVGLLLARAPAVVRTAAFEQSVRAWTAPPAAPGVAAPADAAPESPVAVSRPHPRSRGQEQPVSPTRSAVGGRGHLADSALIQPSPPAPARRAPPPDPEPDLPAPPPGPLGADPAAAETSGPRPDVVPAVRLALIGPAADTETAFGGTFYLLNLALALKLYGDFATPRAPGLSLSPWDLLALLGRTWVGDEFVADPLWPLLAALAGRGADDPPGGNAPPPPPLRGDRPETGPHEDDAGLTWEGWVNRFAEYAATRLALGLGPDVADPVGLLLWQPARVAVRATAVAVHFRLADHPVEIRRAGLDRDPGWVPAAGRSLTYHYD